MNYNTYIVTGTNLGMDYIIINIYIYIYFFFFLMDVSYIYCK